MKVSNEIMKQHEEVLRLFQLACKRYSGGIAAVANIMEVNGTILSNKLNPNNESNHLSLTEACRIVEITGDRSLVSAMAFLTGDVIMPAPQETGCESDQDVLVTFMKALHSASDLGGQITEATKPSSEWGEELSPKEKRDLRPLVDDLIQKAILLKRQIG